MSDRLATTIIDPDLCIGCGMCVRVCPNQSITMHDGKAVVTGTRSLGCGHCAAVCPTGAVWVKGIDTGMLDFDSFKADCRWLPFGSMDISKLVRLIGSRRSCRNFEEVPVDSAMLIDLVKIGILAPSGTNSQKWTFTVVPHRKAVTAFGNRILRFYKNLNRRAERFWLRKLLRWIGKKELDHYFRRYYQTIKAGIDAYEESGKDLLFYGAPSVLIVGSAPGASCPAEDALLATQNILLAAHAMGLGSCLIGFAVSAMQRDKRIQEFMGISRSETIYSVIALGYPDETYQRMAGRKHPLVRFWEGE